MLNHFVPSKSRDQLYGFIIYIYVTHEQWELQGHSSATQNTYRFVGVAVRGSSHHDETGSAGPIMQQFMCFSVIVSISRLLVAAQENKIKMEEESRAFSQQMASSWELVMRLVEFNLNSRATPWRWFWNCSWNVSDTTRNRQHGVSSMVKKLVHKTRRP
jgi:hypothetical protein